MRHAPEERLRWRVLKQFGVLPGEKRAKRMTRRELLYCVLQQQLDGEEVLSELYPVCRAAAMERRCTVCGALLADTEGTENTAFDWERYQNMKEGRSV